MLPNLLQLYSRLLRLSVGNEILIFRENNHGKHWEELFIQLDQDLPVAWSELADAKDLYTVVEHVHSWTTKDINIQGLPPRPGN